MRLISENIIQQIIELYPNSYASDLANKFGISTKSVYSIATKYGVKKSDEFRSMELNKQGEKLKALGEKTRFKKGNSPVNKGKKVTPEVYNAMKPTMFKKGNLPPNTKYDGHERLDKDGYMMVRIRKGKYVLKHRLVWESINGKIPKGMALKFKDGNKMNININNLELISRKDLMALNTIQNYPAELKSTIRTLGKLKRIINEKQN